MSGFLMRLGSPYYLARVALLGVYVAVRILCNDAFSEAIDETTGTNKEVILLLLTALIAMNRVSKRPVLELKVATFLTLALSYCAVTLYFVSTRLCAWFILACMMVGITAGSPQYSGERCVEYIGGLAEINSRVLVKNASKKGQRAVSREETPSHWLVLFNSPSLPVAQEASFIFASIAEKYHHAGVLQFGLVDVDRWPDAAASQHIDPSLKSVQLPSVILYNNGKVSLIMQYRNRL
ncbi:conserved hypothetical protein [Perkinsus marinus ATCC 50983]|uniref:Thioredoxin domain-containing protein n=1 Tax=Perkinsus marinus (strain ATCC 50983 / TXsc) TaxID=423536 RepID=C5L3I1_PERM5|nr:conserved hypothetical protein [Perkinsus marinus ATCC 50983]EER08560.1 conserved hypothetical protein [Perkinsus marinus ATCC 50983]|eukprot:XP_002776744.1 conserved hypothetical protein [Perkinsus marinus ATCC 50983]